MNVDVLAVAKPESRVGAERVIILAAFKRDMR